MAELITIGLFATGLPIFLGILMAYSAIALILGFFLWNSGIDDIGLSIMGSGLIIGVLLIAGAVIIRYALQ